MTEDTRKHLDALLKRTSSSQTIEAMTPVPAGAVFEAELGPGVALYDVSGLLARSGKESRRPTSQIVRVYHHHSGAMGRGGFQGLQASARYSVLNKPEPRFPGPAYTYWLAYAPDVDREGRIAVYRSQQDDVVSWHTGGQANRHGVGVCWQGDLSTEKPSTHQYHAASELCAWLDKRHQLDPNAPHSVHAQSGRWGGNPKKNCPGPHVTRWVSEYEPVRATWADGEKR